MNGFLLDSWLAGEWREQKGKCSYRKLLAPRFVDCFFFNCVFLRKYKHFYSTYLWYRLKNIDGKNHCRWQKKYLFDFGVNNPFKVIFTHLCIKPMTILFYSLKKKAIWFFFWHFYLEIYFNCSTFSYRDVYFYTPACSFNLSNRFQHFLHQWINVVE